MARPDRQCPHFGLSETEFTETIYSNSLVGAPDGDEAFDDGSYVLQFDVGDRVRLIAFQRPDSPVDSASVREIWISSDIFVQHSSAMARHLQKKGIVQKPIRSSRFKISVSIFSTQMTPAVAFAVARVKIVPEGISDKDTRMLHLEPLCDRSCHKLALRSPQLS